MEIVTRYLNAWRIPSQRLTSPNDADAARALRSGDDWGERDVVALIDVDSVGPGIGPDRLRELAGAKALTIVPIGNGERLRLPLRQSDLFDRITAERPVKRPRVLVAEDNASLRELLVIQLDEINLDALIVSNGVLAVAASGREPFALILMDCQMPEMDGYEATRVIRASEIESGAHVPIIAMTANVFPEDREACLAAGMDDHLPKPVRLLALQAILDRWLPAQPFIPVE